MVSLWLTGLLLRARSLLADERGDVPGWVMITVMTAAIAMALWGAASGKFRQLFDNAFATVGPSN